MAVQVTVLPGARLRPARSGSQVTCAALRPLMINTIVERNNIYANTIFRMHVVWTAKRLERWWRNGGNSNVFQESGQPAACLFIDLAPSEERTMD